MILRLAILSLFVITAGARVRADETIGGDAETEQLIETPIDQYDRDHWSFQPIARPAIPSVQNQSWPSTPIDHFILSRLEEKSLTPATEADRGTLIRRLCFDLTGLPPQGAT